MAFWGAPKENASQIPDACAAALACIREVTLLNDRRRAAGAPALNARFGIHTGPVVVGNLGSKERLNYTAIGDTVNLASRLEGLNQYYGTTVLVSSEVVAGLDETWVFRPVDRVAVKGRKAGVTVYELLGGPGYPVQSSLPGLAAALWAAYEARDWSTACEVAERLLAEIPGDLACRVLHERCMHFLEFPPPPDWDGVWKVTEK
jgi:adenylate cyclase